MHYGEREGGGASQRWRHGSFSASSPENAGAVRFRGSCEGLEDLGGTSFAAFWKGRVLVTIGNLGP